MNIRTFYLYDIAEGTDFRLLLARIDGDKPLSPKIGDLISTFDLRNLIFNGNRIVIQPSEERVYINKE